jgi:hypothetical protein
MNNFWEKGPFYMLATIDFVSIIFCQVFYECDWHKNFVVKKYDFKPNSKKRIV